MKFHLFSVLGVGAQCQAEAACWGGHSGQLKQPFFVFIMSKTSDFWGPHVQGQWHNPLWTEDLPPGEEPIPKHLVLTASLEVFDLGASLAALKPWHKLLLNFLLFLPIL